MGRLPPINDLGPGNAVYRMGRDETGRLACDIHIRFDRIGLIEVVPMENADMQATLTATDRTDLARVLSKVYAAALVKAGIVE